MKKYKLSPLLILFMSAFVLIDGTVFSVYAVLSAAAHELGHILALKLAGGKIKNLYGEAKGISLRTGLISYKTEAMVSLCGPLVSLVLFSVFACLTRYVSYNKELLFLAVSNLALFVLNILPVYPLDGGRALYCILALHTEKAQSVTKFVSLMFLLPLWCISVIILVRTGYNLSLMLICVYLSLGIVGVKEIV